LETEFIQAGSEVATDGVGIAGEFVAGTIDAAAEKLDETVGVKWVTDIIDFEAGAASNVVRESAEGITEAVHLAADVVTEALNLEAEAAGQAADAVTAGGEAVGNAAGELGDAVNDGLNNAREAAGSLFGR
jgi:hypothetical protein